MRVFEVSSLLAVSWIITAAAWAQPGRLTQREREQVLALANAAEVPEAAKLLKAKEGAPLLCEMKTKQQELADGTSQRMVTTYHFDYGTGRTLRRVVNIDAGQLVESTVLQGYSPPLAPEELLLAQKVALEASPEVRLLYESSGDVETSCMPSVVVDGESERVGHRIVTIQYRRRSTVAGNPFLKVVVDLSNESIVETETSKPMVNLGADESPPDTNPEPDAEAVQLIEQLFPLNAAPADKESGWRIRFGTEYHGRGEVLYIQSAHFRPSRTAPWLHVLGDCRLAEMFVPYNNGFTRFYDITSIGGSLEKLDRNDFGPRCLGTPSLYVNDTVAVEFHDSRTLWLDHYLPADEKSRRGEEIHIWSVLPTGNYAYIMLYTFRSDGTIGLHVAPTAHNLNSDISDQSTHLHIGCWRLNVVLGDQTRNRIETVRFKSSAALGAKAETVVEPFNAGQEGGIEWTPRDLLRLRITSKFAKNAHIPANFLSYELLPAARQGNARTFGIGEEWTQKDFWVTRPVSPGGVNRDRFNELPDYTATPLTLDNQSAVIWCQAALVHRARDEDFGQVGYNRSDGVAVTGWAGFYLAPRNVGSMTPLYP